MLFVEGNLFIFVQVPSGKIILQLSEHQKELIGKLNVYLEKNGMQPVAAKVMALLMVVDEPELTFDEIQESLQISKSATSNGINYLLDTHRIEYVSKVGERKRYFRNRITNWKDSYLESVERIKELNHIFKAILEDSHKIPQQQEKLRELITFIDFMSNEIRDSYDKWEQQRNN